MQHLLWTCPSCAEDHSCDSDDPYEEWRHTTCLFCGSAVRLIFLDVSGFRSIQPTLVSPGERIYADVF